MPQMIFTDHALERYVKRVDRSVTKEQARKTLQKAVQNAATLREKTNSGETMWTIESPHIRLVTKYDDGDIICVTILSEKEFQRSDASEVEYELTLAYEAEDRRLEQYKESSVVDAEKSKLRGVLTHRQEALLAAVNLVLKSGADATLHIKAAEEHLPLVIAEFGEDARCVSRFKTGLEALKKIHQSSNNVV